MGHLINDFYIIRAKDTNIIYHPSTYTLLDTNANTIKCIEDILKGESDTFIIRKYNSSIHEVATLRSKILSITKKTKVNFITTPMKRSVTRITIHVTNDCNLRCKYCYANGGNYHEEKGIMTKKTAEEFIEFMSSHFDYVGYIVFFGGEPFLNTHIIDYICRTITEQYKSKQIAYLT